MNACRGLVLLTIAEDGNLFGLFYADGDALLGGFSGWCVGFFLCFTSDAYYLLLIIGGLKEIGLILFPNGDGQDILRVGDKHIHKNGFAFYLFLQTCPNYATFYRNELPIMLEHFLRICKNERSVCGQRIAFLKWICLR